MKIYIVSIGYAYEGYKVLAVFSSEEKAKDYLTSKVFPSLTEKYEETSPNCFDAIEHENTTYQEDTYTIECYDLDEL